MPQSCMMRFSSYPGYPSHNYTTGNDKKRERKYGLPIFNSTQRKGQVKPQEKEKKEANKPGILCMKAMTVTYTVYRLTGQREVTMCRLALEVHPATRIIFTHCNTGI